MSNICLAQVIIDIRKQFGAIGDGKSNDTKAFQRAIERVNSLGKNVTLYIPKGTYILHPQQANSGEGAAYIPINIIALRDCSNVTIKGEKGTKIQFSSSLYFGSFKRNGKGLEKLGNKTTDYRYRIAVGHGIYLDNCKNITVQSVEMDGNNRNFLLGSEFGDVGLQIDNDGVFINNSTSVTLKDLNIHHFGRDGVLILNKTEKGFDSPNQNIEFSNCRFEYNGRQGFSWCGGVGLKAVNCFFGNTGKSKVTSPPGAGVDFEPNGGYVVRGGMFVNCTFKSNNGVAVLADEGGFNVRDIDFVNCTIQGERSAALWVKSPAFRFLSCRINGTFYFGCSAQNEPDGTKFVNCVFSDQFSNESPNNFLIESNGTRFLRFETCTFRSFNKGLIYVAAGAHSLNERAEFNNCRFIKYNKSAKTSQGSFTTGVRYTGNTSFIDSSGERSSWNIENSHFLGAGKAKAVIEVGNNNVLASYDVVTVGDSKALTDVLVLQNGALLINTNAKLVIGKEGRLIIKKGGTLWIGPGALLSNSGKIIAEEGSFICVHNDAKVSETSMSNIIIQRTTNFRGNEQLKLGLGGCIIINK